MNMRTRVLLKKLIFLFFILIQVFYLSACHTLIENADLTSYKTNQQQYKNASGETVHRYTEVHQSSGWVNPTLITADRINSHDNTYSTYDSNSSLKNVRDKNSVFVEFSGSGEDLHTGFHLRIIDYKYFILRAGASVVVSQEAYFGLDLSGRYVFIHDYSNIFPLVGLGGFLGDSKTCRTTSAQTQECEKKFLGLGYAELGLQFNQLTFFYRNYSLNRAGISIPATHFLGIGIQF